MTATGFYTLTLFCDQPNCNKADNYEAMNTVVTEPTKMQALAKARAEGWMIKRGCRTRCPDHAAELRDSHWREKKTA